MSASRERGALLAMVLATLLWGGTFVAIRDAVADVPPALLVSTRFLGAGVLFALVLLVRRRLPARRDVAGGALSGLLMVGGYFLQAVGLRSTSAGSSAFLTCAGTLLAAFWAWLLLRERPGVRLTLGLALALAGAALLSGWRSTVTPRSKRMRSPDSATSIRLALMVQAEVLTSTGFSETILPARTSTSASLRKAS